MAIKYLVKAATSEYTDKDGTAKKRYATIGAVFESKHGLMMSLESLPLFGLKEGDFLEDLELSPNVDIAISGLQKAIDQFKAVGKKVVIVVDNPALANPEDCMQRSSSLNFINYFFPKKANKRCILPLEDYLKITKKYRLMLLELENKNKGAVKIFDVTPILCDEEKKSCEFSKNNRSLYSYSDHISDYASGLVGEQLNAFLHHIKN